MKSISETIFSHVNDSVYLRQLHEALHSNQSLLIEELWNAPKALVAALAQRATGKHLLILTGGSQEEARLYHDLAFFTDNPIIDFPAWETLPSENIPPSPDIVGDRYKALRMLSSSSQPHIVLSNLHACLQKLIPLRQFDGLYLHLSAGKIYPFASLIDQLQAMGYQRNSVASDKGQFALRGGIIDIFPVSSPDPYRLEFWDDELESIRIYDPIGQKSVRPVKEAEITPAQELELLEKGEMSSIFDYLGPNTIVVYDDLLALEDRYTSLVSMAATASKSFGTIEEFLDRAAPLQQLYWSQQPIEQLSEIEVLREKGEKTNYYSASAQLHQVKFSLFNRSLSAYRWTAPFATLAEVLVPEIEDLEKVSGSDILLGLGKLSNREEVRLVVLCPTELDEATFHKRVQDAAIALPKNTTVTLGYLSSGLVIDDLALVLLPLTEITKHYKIRRQKLRSTYHTSPVAAYELAPGEMVVHYNNGIGRYLGMEKRTNHAGINTEFLAVEYAEGGKLYVPLNQAHLINKYIGSGEETPRMHTLGSTRWKRARENAETAIMAYAADLLDLYAKRQLKGGFACASDSGDMAAFEEEFAFEETEDQLAAIAAIKEDMSSNKAMDRLVCGDVGYGKTEVAMRAACKAVVDGHKQVAVLVPTTVLAMQHYENFIDRFRNFPITIGVLSRFRSAKETAATLKGVAEGSVDIVIGTHRIISQDVAFHDLGLVIIDEEQRFGVKAKEHLKKLKVGVDCLTLSATPIPRTLYMSLIGARDMSVINTPPQDRLPIATVISESNEIVIKNALMRELARDGQAFVIHNRVETIFEYAQWIKKMVPQARTVVVHGQMSTDEIDTVFHTFKKGDADILVATTIVESGIDIPNANTIIIDRADRFGMADLYQLRGRVGRWNRRAYAYLLVPRQRSMPEIVTKRLQALASSSGYGGGMKVAMHDLEIRGAGNILGLEQSGQVSSIGFHLYCKLLKRAISAMQGKTPAVIADAKVEIAVDARFPEEYIGEMNLRMELYCRFGEALSWEEVDEIWGEVRDRFGQPPEPAVWLYHLTRVRVFAALHGFTLIKQEAFTVTVERKQGKVAVSRKFLMPKVKGASAWEKKLVELLSKEFKL